ncbi:hypothetical protein HDV00_000760 [Rhizophlyctis rosea]|nr:hypothetical protein HDV00_000760 [Rhizophlyctis rosea]
MSLRAVPIHPLRIVPTTLAVDCLNAAEDEEFRAGYLTIDQARHVLLLLDGDPFVKDCPLVGIWTQNAQTIRHPSVHNACLRFLVNNRSVLKMETGQNAILVVLFVRYGGRVGAEFWEVGYEVREPVVEAFGGVCDVDDVLGGGHEIEVGALDICADSMFCDALEEELDIRLPRRPVLPTAAEDRMADTEQETFHDNTQHVDAGTTTLTASFHDLPPSLHDPPPLKSSTSPIPSQQTPSALRDVPSPSPPPAQADPAHLYAALLQQQMEMMKLFGGSGRDNGGGINMAGARGAGPPVPPPPMPMFPFMPYWPTAPLNSKPAMKDAETNTTMVATPISTDTDSVSPIQATVIVPTTNEHATSPRRTPSPFPSTHKQQPIATTNTTNLTTMNPASTLLTTTAAAELESVVRRGVPGANKTFALPPDTGSNYRAFVTCDSVGVVGDVVQGRGEGASIYIPREEGGDGEGDRSEVVFGGGGSLEGISGIGGTGGGEETFGEDDGGVGGGEEGGGGRGEKGKGEGHTGESGDGRDIIASLVVHPDQTFIVL